MYLPLSTDISIDRAFPDGLFSRFGSIRTTTVMEDLPPEVFADAFGQVVHVTDLDLSDEEVRNVAEWLLVEQQAQHESPAPNGAPSPWVEDMERTLDVATASPVEPEGYSLSQAAAYAAKAFFANTYDLLSAMPTVYPSSKGDLFVEFKDEKHLKTAVVSPQFLVLLFMDDDGVQTFELTGWQDHVADLRKKLIELS